MTTITAATKLEALKKYLQIAPENTDKDALFTMLLESCTEAAEKFLGRNIIAREIIGEPHDFDGLRTKYIQLENYPVIEITQILQDGVPLESAAYKTDTRSGIIKNTLTHWRGVVMADYRAGLAEDAENVPPNIQLALWQWVADILQMQDSCGVRRETLGDYSVSYYDEHAIPPAVALLLEPYRKVSL